MGLVGHAALLVSFPVAAAAAVAGIGTVRKPGPRLVSAIQPFAAGVVIAALAGAGHPPDRPPKVEPDLTAAVGASSS